MQPVPGEVPAQSAVRRSAVPLWHELWQIPLFCIGVFSLLLVWTFRPAHAKVVPAARSAYEKAWLALDLEDVVNAERWLHCAEQAFADNSIAEYQLKVLDAAVYLARLRQSHPLPVSTPSGKQQYLQIRQDLERISDAVVPQERVRLNYLILVAKLAADGVAIKTLDQLEELLDTDFADRRDGYQLLSQLRSQTEPPDLGGSLRAIDRLLATPELKRPNAARLQKAQVLAQLEKWSDVIKTCHSIPVDADEYWAALQCRALAEFHLQHWSEAERAWCLIKEPQQTPTMLLFYGMSHQQLKTQEHRAEAAKIWERLRIMFPGTPEAVKATLYLSQLSSSQGRWPDAVSYLATVLRSQQPKSFQNPYVTRDEIWQQVGECEESLIKLHRWEDVRYLGEAALSWSQKGVAESWLALAWHSLAEGASVENIPTISQLEAFRKSAEFAWRAATAPQAEAKEKWLDLAGRDALQAKIYPLAQSVYGEWLTVPPSSAQRSAVLIGLAISLEKQGQLDDARDRLREACKLGDALEATAHLHLFHVFEAQKLRDDAGHELEEAAKFVTRPNHHPDAAEAAHLRVRYLYYLWVIDPKEILRAVEAGETALKFADKHPLVRQTRYLLAEVLKSDATEQLKAAGAFPMGKTAEQFLQALKYFQLAARDLAQSEATRYDDENRINLLRFACLGQAECLFFLGNLARHVTSEPLKADMCWLQAEQIFRDIGAQSSSKLEVLYTRYWSAQCQGKRGLSTDMGESIRCGLQLLDEMTDADFQQSPLIKPPWRSRDEWRKLFEELRKTTARSPVSHQLDGRSLT